VPRDPLLHVVNQLLAFMCAVGNGPRAGCTKRAVPQCLSPVCPLLFLRSVDRGRSFDISRLPTADEASAMVRFLWHVGYNPALFSGISARRCGLSTAIEAGVPEPILWMQSWHSQDVAARYCITHGRHFSSSIARDSCALPVLRWVAACSARLLAPAGPGPGWARTDQQESGQSSESSGQKRLELGGRAGPGCPGLAGPGQARTHSGVRLQARGGRCWASPSRGGRAQPALFPPLGVAVLLCVCVSVVISAAWIWLLLAGLASTPPHCFVVDALLMGASWRNLAQVMQGFSPLCSEPCAGRDGVPGPCFIACRSCQVC
jgi:hypothetical protein